MRSAMAAADKEWSVEAGSGMSPVVVNEAWEPRTCHSYRRIGVWEFLSDCTHDMAGQKVPMIDFPENYRVQAMPPLRRRAVRPPDSVEAPASVP